MEFKSGRLMHSIAGFVIVGIKLKRYNTQGISYDLYKATCWMVGYQNKIEEFSN